MSQKNPEVTPNVQMTPVQFSPPASKDALGNVGGFLPQRHGEFPVFIPMTIIVLTLIFATIRDISTFNRSVTDIERTNAPALEILKQANKQTEYINALKAGLQTIAPNDPAAAQILQEFFPEKKPDAAKPAPDAAKSAQDAK